MSDQQYQEISAETPDGQSLFALINGDRGWLMYLRANGDAGFSSRNPDYADPEDAVIDYVLSNGQRDEYPASWALPKAEVLRALEFFAENAGRLRSCSGTTIPGMAWKFRMTLTHPT
jgi:hypothetical protein